MLRSAITEIWFRCQVLCLSIIVIVTMRWKRCGEDMYVVCEKTLIHFESENPN